MIPGEDIPFEDVHMTKSIVRMEMNMIAQAIIHKEPITKLHELLRETNESIAKLKDKEIDNAFQDIRNLIDDHYPICESTNWEIIASLGAKFRFIDEETLY